ncbi:MAG: thiolase C-terminal domain-containing protein [Candidatus Aenigmatarchaeota archaeon]
MSKKVAIVGAGHTEFGELWHRSWIDLVEEAGLEALEDADIEKRDIDKFFIGNMSLGMFAGQEHTAAKVFSEVFDGKSSSELLGRRIEGACSSGGLALEAGFNDVLAGLERDEDRIILVGGFEKMTDKPTEEATRILAGASDVEKEIGFTFPALYGMMKDRYLYETDAEEDDFHLIAVKSHKNATLNPKAQYNFEITLDTVKNSTAVADPTKLFNASGIADGAAVVIMTTEDRAKELGADYVLLEDIQGRNDTIALYERDDLLTLSATEKAAESVFEKTSLEPEDVDVAEVHDCFSVAEALALEDLGFYPKRKSWKGIRKSLEEIDGMSPPVPYELENGHKVYINTSGGLKAKGHPVGATGVAQAVEVVDQLRGKCGERQVEDAKIGLTHNVGGSGGTAVVGIYKKPDM